MNSNENTVFGTADKQPKNETKKQQTGASGWQQVTIGGVTGILMGAAGMYVANAFAGEQPAEADGQPTESTADGAQSHTTDNGLHVAEVDQSLPFGEAFAAARAEVGPGGVFHWHGGIYNTYTAQEWSAMSDSEHQQFALQVQPEIQPGEERTGQQDVAQHTHRNDDNRHGNDDKPEKPTPPKDDAGDEPEVHFLGVEQVQTDGGQTMNVGRMVIGSEEVALVDVDDNMVFDVAISDRNDNGQIDDDEVTDISDRQLSVTDFALASAIQQEGSDPAQPQMANNAQQDHIADDMPDYMNDADVQTI